MLTRCPGCQTVFRLTSEQLLARQGRVRCGSCLHPFNALDHLAESDPKAGQQPDRQRQPVKSPEKRPAPATSAHSATTVIPGTKPAAVQSVPVPDTSPKTGQVLAPVIKKTSQRLLNELDFSSSIDTQSRVSKPAQQWTASQNFPTLDQRFTDTLIPPAPTQAPPFAPVESGSSPPASPAPPAKADPPVPTPLPAPSPKAAPPAPAPLPAPPPKAAPPAPAPLPAPLPEAAPPAPTPLPARPPESLTIVLSDPLDDAKAAHSPKESPPAPESSPPPLSEASLAPQDELPLQITRSRENRERKREKSRGKSRRRKQAEPGRASRWASTLVSIGKALEERTGWGRRRKRAAPATTVDNEVLSEIFSKLGLETKIDKIEAEFDAEARAARTEARNKTIIAAKSAAPVEKSPPSHFDVYGDPDTHVHHHKLWTTAVCVLGIVLVIQAVFLFRNHIARTFPSARPALVSLCNTLGCTMPLPREASRIEIADYGFARRSDRGTRYVFFAKVTNSANFAQDWPNLELVLKNDINQPLSRRIFTPAEWVPPEKFAASVGMPPRSNVDVNMELEVTGIVPSNFDLGHFYP